MKINNHIKNVMDKSNNIIIAFFLYCICLILLLVVGLIHNFFGMNLLGQFFSVLALLISFLLIGKVFFNVNYSGLFKEIKLSKCDCMDNLLITMFFFLQFLDLLPFLYIK